MGQIWACEEVQFQELVFVFFFYAVILRIYFGEETKKHLKNIFKWKIQLLHPSLKTNIAVEYLL